MIITGDETAVGLTARTREKDAGDEGSVPENERGLRPSVSTRKVRNYKGPFTLSESKRFCGNVDNFELVSNRESLWSF